MLHTHKLSFENLQISTITLKVDLECTRCYKKISKTISKIQGN